MGNEEAFWVAIQAAGIEVDKKIIVADGKLYRFHVAGDRPGSRNGWCVLFPDDPPVGAFGCWRRAISETWSLRKGGGGSSLMHRFRVIDQFLEDNHRQGRENSVGLWNQANGINKFGSHPYLRKKKILPHGTRTCKGALLVPVMDFAGQIHGLQRIYDDGSKYFTRHTNKSGHCFPLGDLNRGEIFIAEGFATAATIHELTGETAIVAFDTGNLEPVASRLRQAYPDSILIFCADNDRFQKGNPGFSCATKAAATVKGIVILPDFTDPASCGTDVNDLCLEEGADVARSFLSSWRGR